MRRFKKLFIVLSGLALSASAIFGTALSINKEAKPAEATTLQSVYMTLDNYNTNPNYQNYWIKSGKSTSDLRAYFYGGSCTQTWDGASTVAATVTYGGVRYVKFNVPAGSPTSVIFYTKNWDNDAKQTEDLTIPTNGNFVFTMNTSNGNSKQNGYWEKYVNEVKNTSEYSKSNSTARVFFYNTGSNWSGGGTSAIQAWGSSSFTTSTNVIYVLTWFQDDNGQYYGYADLPLDITGFQFVLLDSGAADVHSATIWNTQYQTKIGDKYTVGGTFTLANGNSCVCYGTSDSADKAYLTVSVGGVKNDVAGANIMKKLCEAYNTCSSNSYNGWGAYTRINNYFYSHATAAAKSATVTSINGDKNYTVEQHIAGLADGYNAGARPHGLPADPVVVGEFNSNNGPLIVVLSLSAVALVAVGGYFFIRRKADR